MPSVLGDHVSLQRGTTYKGQLLGSPGPVLLGLGTIQRNGGFRRDSLKTYGGDCPDHMTLGPGDIYVSLKDVTQAGDLLGSVARVPADVPAGRLTQDTVQLVLSGSMPGDYLYWLLRTPQYREYCRSRATGTTNLGLSRDDFLSLPVPEPTLDRTALVEQLEALEHKIDLNRRMNETLEELARSIFRSWFVDFDPVRAKAEGGQPVGMDAETAAVFPDRMAESELGDTPQGWGVRSLYDSATYINGAAYRDFHFCDPADGLPIIKIAELKSGVTEQTRFTNTVLHDRYRLDTGDILFSWSGNPDTSIDTFVWTHGPAWLNQHIFKVVPHVPEERVFVFRLLRHLRPVFAEIARDKQTTGLGHVTAADMRRLWVVSPPREILVAANRVLGPLFERWFASTIESQILASLRDTLLPKLISGEIRIQHAEKVVGEAT